VFWEAVSSFALWLYRKYTEPSKSLGDLVVKVVWWVITLFLGVAISAGAVAAVKGSGFDLSKTHHIVIFSLVLLVVAQGLSIAVLTWHNRQLWLASGAKRIEKSTKLTKLLDEQGRALTLLNMKVQPDESALTRYVTALLDGACDVLGLRYPRGCIYTPDASGTRLVIWKEVGIGDKSRLADAFDITGTYRAPQVQAERRGTAAKVFMTKKYTLFNDWREDPDYKVVHEDRLSNNRAPPYQGYLITPALDPYDNSLGVMCIDRQAEDPLFTLEDVSVCLAIAGYVVDAIILRNKRGL